MQPRTFELEGQKKKGTILNEILIGKILTVFAKNINEIYQSLVAERKNRAMHYQKKIEKNGYGVC